MRKHTLICLLLVMLVLPARAQEKIELGKDIEVYPLAPGIWRHVTCKAIEGWGNVPANGLIVVSEGHAAMIDTPWTPEQTATLLDWVQNALKAKVEAAIVGHSHEDCLGGLPEIHKRGIVSIGLDKTRALALAAGVEAPQQTFTGERKLMVGKRELELFYPGAGHTVDNIVTWIAAEKILFSGCLVKSADATSLGNIKEADLAAWPVTLANVKNKYPAARLIVPGHGDPGGWELVENTLKLLKENSKTSR
jgi:metallo-beta-lactamase class B